MHAEVLMTPNSRARPAGGQFVLLSWKGYEYRPKAIVLKISGRDRDLRKVPTHQILKHANSPGSSCFAPYPALRSSLSEYAQGISLLFMASKMIILRGKIRIKTDPSKVTLVVSKVAAA